MAKKQKFPILSLVVLSIIIFLSIFAELFAPYAEDYMNSSAICLPPCDEYLLGTDNLGRDLFTMLLYGGRASLIIGICAGVISGAIAVLAGVASGTCGRFVDELIMRICELLLSIPSILLIIFLQAIWGAASYTSLSVIIGITSWPNMAKIVRTEVRQLRESDYILAARLMEGSFIYIMIKHLLPNFISSIMYMLVSNIGSAIITESTLSFLGLGLPLTTVSWGSLLSIAKEVLLSGSWWLIVMPGMVLTTTLVCITQLGEYIRKKNNRLHSNL